MRRPVSSRGAKRWTVADVLCTCGTSDRPFEERHPCYTVAIVLAGSFQVPFPGRPGTDDARSLMLGNHGQCFECGHQHGEGDRCVSFWFRPTFRKAGGRCGSARKGRALPGAPAAAVASVIAACRARRLGRDWGSRYAMGGARGNPGRARRDACGRCVLRARTDYR